MPPEPTHGAAGQLVDVLITRIAFERNWVFELVEETPPSYVIDASTNATVVDDRTGGMVELDAAVIWRQDDELTDGPFDLRLTVEAYFRWQLPEVPEDSIKGWLEFNGEHLLWPYLRAEISRITGASGLPPLTIYTIGIPRPHLGHENSPAAEEAAAQEAPRPSPHKP